MSRPQHRNRRSWWLRASLLVGLLVLAVVVPLAVAAGNAWAAKRGLEQALEALSAGDVDRASALAHEAREDARDVDRATFGFSGFVWGLLPGAGADKADVRHLSSAAVDITDVVILAADAYPDDRSGDGFLLGEDGSIDVVALEAVLGEYDDIQAEVDAAARATAQVEGHSPLLGPVLRSTGSLLDERLERGASAMRTLRPLAPVLPRLLGADEEQSLLVAVLNPAEQRYSGGASLSFMTLTLDEGRLGEGDTVIGAEDDETFARFAWPPVENNIFHKRGQRLRLSTATLAPSWSISGEELLRAWDERQGSRTDGLIAVDVVALQDLMRFTGPITVPGYGTLDSTNLTQQLVGSYESYTGPEAFAERRAGSAQLVAEFQRRIATGSGLVGKVESIASSADARRFMAYHRDPAIARAFAHMGLDGDLSDTPHDYVGVFNQALSGLKSDYWQKRTIRHDVTLREDGSAHVEHEVTIFNDAPPPATGVDPQYAAYVRRDNEMSLATFLPIGQQDLTVELDGSPLSASTRRFRGREFLPVQLGLAPGATRTLLFSYDVPAAAEVVDGRLRYRLDVDPQSLVQPAALEVNVRWPRSLRLRSAPDGWSTSPRSAQVRDDALTTSPRWRLQLVPRQGGA